MDRKKLDDALYALGQTFAFFNKEMDEFQIAVWKNFLLKHDPDVMMKAMQMQIERGKFAPKPVDLTNYAEQIIANEQAKTPPVKALPESDCPKELSDAWRWALKVFHNQELYKSMDVDDETAEKYLLLVNQQAKHYNNPLAIPDQFKLVSVWGKDILLKESNA